MSLDLVEVRHVMHAPVVTLREQMRLGDVRCGGGSCGGCGVVDGGPALLACTPCSPAPPARLHLCGRAWRGVVICGAACCSLPTHPPALKHALLLLSVAAAGIYSGRRGTTASL